MSSRLITQQRERTFESLGEGYRLKGRTGAGVDAALSVTEIWNIITAEEVTEELPTAVNFLTGDPDRRGNARLSRCGDHRASSFVSLS